MLRPTTLDGLPLESQTGVSSLLRYAVEYGTQD
jgi:hypothetical protein